MFPIGLFNLTKTSAHFFMVLKLPNQEVDVIVVRVTSSEPLKQFPQVLLVGRTDDHLSGFWLQSSLKIVVFLFPTDLFFLCSS